MNEWADYLEQRWPFYFTDMTRAVFLVLMLFYNLAFVIKKWSLEARRASVATLMKRVGW